VDKGVTIAVSFTTKGEPPDGVVYQLKIPVEPLASKVALDPQIAVSPVTTGRATGVTET
jgi:hypothetical protein